MKNLLFLFIAITSSFIFSQEVGPKIEFESLEINYGKISKGDNGIRIFKFTNVGSKPLIINKVYSSCGCTIPKKPEKPILPGESGSIDVEYDTKRTGAFQKAITVNSNAVNSNIVLRIKGEILPEPELDENGNPIENPKENKIVFKSTTFLFCSISFKLFPVM